MITHTLPLGIVTVTPLAIVTGPAVDALYPEEIVYV
jgi:hypothetical protein